MLAGKVHGVVVQMTQNAFDEDRKRFFIRVFDFRFRQRRFAHRTPVHGLAAFINVTFFRHLTEYGEFAIFQFRIERQIRTIPIAHDAETNEVFLLNFDKFFRVGEAFGAQFQR